MKIITHSGQKLTVCEYHKLKEKELIYVEENSCEFILHINCEWYNFKCECDESKRLGWMKKWVCNQCGLVDDNYNKKSKKK